MKRLGLFSCAVVLSALLFSQLILAAGDSLLEQKERLKIFESEAPGARKKQPVPVFAPSAAGPRAPRPFDPAWRTSSQIAKLKRERAEGSLRFAVMGDSRPDRWPILRYTIHPYHYQFEKFLVMQGALDLDFSMLVGDFVMVGKREQYREFLETLKEYKVNWPFLTAIGNHEVIEKSGLAHYRQAFGDLDYFFDFKEFRFVTLATFSEKNGLSESQLAWLEDKLKTPLRKIVFTHMPPRQIAGWKDSDFSRWVAKIKNEGFQGGSERFVTLMAEHRVERVYMGHLHGFGVANYKGVRYVLTGGAGSPLYLFAPAHRIYNFVLVELDASRKLREWVYLKDGQAVPMERYPVYPSFEPLLESSGNGGHFKKSQGGLFQWKMYT